MAYKKAAAKKAAAPKKAAPAPEVFRVDYNAPPPGAGRGINGPLLEKIDRTVEGWKQGGAVVIPRVKSAAVMAHLREKHGHNVWALNKIPGNEEEVRIYLIRKNPVPPPGINLNPVKAKKAAAVKKAHPPAGSHAGNGTLNPETVKENL